MTCDQKGPVVRGGSPQPPGATKGEMTVCLLCHRLKWLLPLILQFHVAGGRGQRELLVPGLGTDVFGAGRTEWRITNHPPPPPPPQGQAPFQVPCRLPLRALPHCVPTLLGVGGWAPIEAACPGSLSGKAVMGTRCQLSPKLMLSHTHHSGGAWQRTSLEKLQRPGERHSVAF